MVLVLRSLVVLCLAVASVAESQTVDTTRYTILAPNGESGLQKAWTDASGARVFYFPFNDRGRGPALTERVTLGADGYPRHVEISGHDYLKAPVSEEFIAEQSGSNTKARWKNGSESSSVVINRPAYYVGLNDASVGLLEHLLL